MHMHMHMCMHMHMSCHVCILHVHVHVCMCGVLVHVPRRYGAVKPRAPPIIDTCSVVKNTALCCAAYLKYKVHALKVHTPEKYT